MTRDEATTEARRLAAEHPDRATHQWLVREQGEGWGLTKVKLPAGKRIDPLKTSVESRPKPAPADDPRDSYNRNVGGPWVA